MSSALATTAVQSHAAVMDASEFRTLYDSGFAHVWNLLRRLGVPDAERDDLVQDVFVVVYRRMDDYDRERPLKPWLTGITLRVCKRYWRTVQRHPRVDGVPPEIVDERMSPEKEVQALQTREFLRDAVPAPSVPAPRAPKKEEKAQAHSDSLGSEQRLLERARSGLARGKRSDALSALREHQRRFPRGRLVEEREALTVLTLVALGRTDKARVRAKRFRKRFPDSILLPVVEDALRDLGE